MLYFLVREYNISALMYLKNCKVLRLFDRFAQLPTSKILKI